MSRLGELVDRASLSVDKQFEDGLLTKVEGALDVEGSVIYIRNNGGRLQWVRANVHGGRQEWEDFSPSLARRNELSAASGEQEVIDAEKKEKLKAIKIGWYQDFRGNLYQFDGSNWAGSDSASLLSHRPSVENLEYLG